MLQIMSQIMLQSDALYSWSGNVWLKQTIEFKRELNDKFEKEVVGFFNSKCRHIFIWINDDDSIYGVG